MKHAPGQAVAALSEVFCPPPGEGKPSPALVEVPSAEVLFDEQVALGIEALRRENEKFLEAEVAKWNALTPHEKPFEWQGKSAAEILAWRNAKLQQLPGLREGADTRENSHACCCEKTPGGLARCGAFAMEALSFAKHHKTTYEEKLARWKRTILEEKIIDLDDAAFEEKFAEWDTHALRLESLKQDILRLEKKAVELKIEELKEQAARQQSELKKTE